MLPDSPKELRRVIHLVEHLTVLVCTLEREPIWGSLRHAWMRELCPQAEVLHVTDDNPQIHGQPFRSPTAIPVKFAAAG